MDLEELEDSLPDGFHDARLYGMVARYDRAELEMELDLSVGDPDAESSEERDAYKRATLKLTGLECLTIEPRGTPSDGLPHDGLFISAGPGIPAGHQDGCPNASAECFKYWF